ncbi:MAG TPA: hypothetical protein ENF87_03040, partial [Thermoproteales archaeon]|nr:hypothetical protein [Thermoproteales archaeon]
MRGIVYLVPKLKAYYSRLAIKLKEEPLDQLFIPLPRGLEEEVVYLILAGKFDEIYDLILDELRLEEVYRKSFTFIEPLF